MNNYILINRTFAEATPESAEDGGFSKTGFIEENEQVSFSELVNLMIDHREASDSSKPGNVCTWYSTGFFTSDYRTATDREESIHFSIENTPNAHKYWKLARLAADKKLSKKLNTYQP